MMQLTRQLRVPQLVKKPFIVSFSTTPEKFNIVGSIFENGKPQVGKQISVTHTFSLEDVRTFAGICGDNNPLHTDPEFAKTTMFGGPIVHGIFVSSLISTLFGRSIHGAIYVSQNLSFRRPVHVGVPVTARVEVMTIEDKKKGLLVTCKTTCSLENGDVAIDGDAKVLLPK